MKMAALTFYVLIYLLQTIKSQDRAIMSDKENTLFPQNGPVFMRQVHNNDEPHPYTEATVEYFNGTFSHQVWRFVEVSPSGGTTTMTTTDPTTTAVDYNEFYDIPNSPMSSSDAVSSANDFSVDTSTDSIQSALDSSNTAIQYEYDLVTSNVETTSAPPNEIPVIKNILRSDSSIPLNENIFGSSIDSFVPLKKNTAIQYEYDLVTSNVETTSAPPYEIPVIKNILRSDSSIPLNENIFGSSIDSFIPLKKNIIRAGVDDTVLSEVDTETSNSSFGAPYSSIITTPSASGTTHTLYPISGAIDHINPEASMKLPPSEMFTPQNMHLELDNGPEAIIQSKEVTTEDVMREDDLTTEKEQRSDNVETNNPVYLEAMRTLRPDQVMRTDKEYIQSFIGVATTTQAAIRPYYTAKEPMDIRPDDIARDPRSDLYPTREPIPGFSESIYEPGNIQANLAPRGDQVVTNADEMEAETDPFSKFLEKLLMLLASKNMRELPNLIQPLEKYLIIIVDSGKLMKLGISTSSYIAQVLPLLKSPVRDLQRQFFVAKVSLQYRKQMLSPEVNAILSEMDDVYDVHEEEAMQRVLTEVDLFPNTGKTGDDIVKGFIDDVFIHPMHRIAGTAKGKVIFEHISTAASKYTSVQYTPVAMSARRFASKVDSRVTLKGYSLAHEIQSSRRRKFRHSHRVPVRKRQKSDQGNDKLHGVNKPSDRRVASNENSRVALKSDFLAPAIISALRQKFRHSHRVPVRKRQKSDQGNNKLHGVNKPSDRRFASNENSKVALKSVSLARGYSLSRPRESRLSHTVPVRKRQKSDQRNDELHVNKPSDKSLYVNHRNNNKSQYINEDESDSKDKPLVVEIVVNRRRKSGKRVGNLTRIGLVNGRRSISRAPGGRRHRTRLRKIFHLRKGKSEKKGVDIQIKIRDSNDE